MEDIEDMEDRAIILAAFDSIQYSDTVFSIQILHNINCVHLKMLDNSTLLMFMLAVVVLLKYKNMPLFGC